MKERQVEHIDETDSPETQERRFREFYAMFIRGRWMLLVFTLIGVGAMAVITHWQKPVYEATATVLINPRAGQGANPLTQLSEGTPRSNVPNEIAILKTRSLAEDAAQTLLDHPYLDETKTESLLIIQQINDRGEKVASVSVEQIGKALLKSLEFTPQRESDIIAITCQSSDAREAAIISNVYAQAYQHHTMMQSRTRSRSIREFLDSRLGEQRQYLQRAEGSVKNFMESAGVVSLDNESGRIVQELSTFEANRNAIDIDIESTTKRLASMEEELPQAETSVAKTITQASDPYIRQMQEQLATLEVQRDVITTQNDPAVLGQAMYRRELSDLDSQIKGLRAKLEERSKEFIQSFLRSEGSGGQADPVGYLRTLKTQMLEAKFLLETLKSRRTALDRIIRQYDAKFKQIPRQSIELARLQRERLGSERLYTLIEERFNEAAITEKSEFGYVDIIDKAGVSNEPESPKPLKNLLIGLLFGLVGGVGAVLLRDSVDVRIRIPEHLQKRGYTSLTEIYPMHRELKSLKGDDRLPREVKRFNPNLWLIFDPLSYVAESYRRLRTNLLRSQVGATLKTIVLTSPNPGEGKSTTICNLAIVLTETQKRVILVDADLRRPTLHSNFGLALKPGLADYLSGKAPLNQVIQRSVVEGLDVITCGSVQRQPARIIASSSMRDFVEELRELYDLVLIDAPPVLVVNDAALLSGMVDAIILTVAAGETRAATLDRATEFIERAGGKILGVVLNRFDAQREYGRYYGGYRYGHYAAYDTYYRLEENAAKIPSQ